MSTKPPSPFHALMGKAMLLPLARGGRRGLSTLIYHRVLSEPDPLFPGELDRAGFARQIALIKSCCNVLPLLDAVHHLRAGTLPPRAACITFDDGYADNADVALPVLQHYGVPATFFVASGFLDGGCMWNDAIIDLVRQARGAVIDARPLGLDVHPVATIAERRAAIAALIGRLKYLPMAERQAQVARLAAIAGGAPAPDLMMTSDQVRQLRAAGMQIGAHTVNHPILARLPSAQARAEIADGKRALEDITGATVKLFAYPNGKPGEDYLAEHVTMARELGFDGAVSTAWGASRDTPDLFQMPRFTPWDRAPSRFMLRLARNLTATAATAASAPAGVAASAGGAP
jgi:peptidoglycan/xylan/chitin deacetylase (PgdA/CDA1 family)